MSRAVRLGLGTPEGTAGKAARLAVPRVARARQRVRKQVQQHRVHAGVAAGGATGVVVAENPCTSVPNPSTISHHISPLSPLSLSPPPPHHGARCARLPTRRCLWCVGRGVPHELAAVAGALLHPPTAWHSLRLGTRLRRPRRGQAWWRPRGCSFRWIHGVDVLLIREDLGVHEIST